MMRDNIRVLDSGETDRVALLERRIAKLEKINSVLMQRVERSMEQQANAFSLFQTAIGLEAQVRMRTVELKSALERLEVTNDELVLARDAAERANRFKTRFFTAVGHDLLQPLHAARLSLSAIAQSDADEQNERLTGRIDHALSTIEELLRTLLDLSKLEAGAIHPNVKLVPLNELFANLKVDAEPIAREKGLSLRFRPTRAMVASDPLMLRRIMQNLLANAVRYTESGRILVAARERGEDIRLDVWDTGPGITPAESQRIFEEFQRGAASERSGGTGFGLGLSIVQRMAAALDHRVELCSKQGRGTRFSVTAPFAGCTSAEFEARRPESAQAAYGFAATRVIVIDNDVAVLDAMNALLQRWSCDVRLARDLGDIAREIASGPQRPDLILADFHLDHGVNGLAAVARLRDVWGASVPAIVITADHSAEIAREVHEAHCEILRKPVKPAELRALMLHVMGARSEGL